MCYILRTSKYIFRAFFLLAGFLVFFTMQACLSMNNSVLSISWEKTKTRIQCNDYIYSYQENNSNSLTINIIPVFNSTGVIFIFSIKNKTNESIVLTHDNTSLYCYEEYYLNPKIPPIFIHYDEYIPSHLYTNLQPNQEINFQLEMKFPDYVHFIPKDSIRGYILSVDSAYCALLIKGAW